MKKIIYIAFIFCLTQAFIRKASPQANVQLSNLVGPTKVNVSLLPDKDNMRSLGNSNKQWKDIYMRGIVWNGDKTFLGGYFSNTYVGQNAGYTLITGVYSQQSNTFVGSNSGFANTTGGYNTFLGSSTGGNNTTGGSNTFVGESAGWQNTSGDNNTFLGVHAGVRNTTGNKNVIIGEAAGAFNKTGGNNVYIGSVSGFSNGAGNYNTFVGDSAGTAVKSSLNTMIGSKSGASSYSGIANTFVGANSALNNTTGSYNTAFGYASLLKNAGAAGNTAIGYGAGNGWTNGSNNTFLGYDADANGGSFTNSMALGRQARITESNQVRIGNSLVESIGGYVGWTDLPSDARFKKNIKENVPGLQFINQLRPVTYNMDVIKLNQFLNTENGNETNALEKIFETDEALIKTGIEGKEKIVRTGFIAQEVEVAAKRLGYDFSGVDKPQNKNSLYGLRYAEFVVPLVKAVQELSKKNDEKDSIIESMLKRIEALEKQNGVAANTNISAAESTSLNQNVPNPFNASTLISYSIPKTARSAKMNITDEKGRTVKTIILSSTSGKISVNSHGLTSGNYFYELIIDSKKYSSRKMTVIK